MSDDLISRQAAIDSLIDDLYDLLESDMVNNDFIREGLMKVPSVQPKTGRWEPLFGTIGKVFKCSECSATVTVAYECFKDDCYYDYCPYCGAKMEGKRNV